MIKERIIQLIEYKGIPKEEFYKKIGMTSASFRGEAKKTPLNSNAIENILSEVPDLSPDWLLTGKGEMTRQKNFALQPAGPGEGIPLIPADAMAGFGQGDTQIMWYDATRYVVPEFSDLKVDFMIRVKGPSMYPKYSSGDLVACKKIPLTDIFFQWNKVYVLDTVQGPLIKRIHPGPDDDHITLVSDNAAYKPFSLPVTEIYAIAIVVGVIRFD